jgi:pseudaminic acid cytidylyltransferase
MTRRIAIIPARSGSSRIIDKNIVEFCGRPLLTYGLAAAHDSNLFDTIHVSTDSPRYADVAASAGHPVDFLRTPEMSANSVSITAVLRWVLGEYTARGENFDEVCLIVATAPLLQSSDLIAGQQLLTQTNGGFPVLSVASFPAPVERAMLIDESRVLRFAQPELRTLHSQECPPQYFDAGAFAFFKTEQVVESAETVYSEYTPYILDRHKATDINEPEDLTLAEVLFLGLRTLSESGRRK